MLVPQYPFPVVGGLEKQAHELAKELVRQGHEVRVISGRTARRQPDQEIVEGVQVDRLPWTHVKVLRWLAMPWLMWRAFRRHLPVADVVHSHVFSGFGLASILLSHWWGKPALVKLPNIGSDGIPAIRAQRFGFLRELIFKQADAVVAMSTESIRELEAVGFDRRRVLATPNGIAPMQRTSRDGRPHGVTVRLVFVGRLDGQKGVPDLFAALSRLSAERSGIPDWTLDLIGDGPLRAQLQSTAEQSGIAGRVRFLGHVSEVRRALEGYDALVLPSYREGNSNAILEAMAAGLPIVSTRVGGTPMLVGLEGAGLLHDAGDVEALARLLGQVISNAELRLRLGSGMRARVERSFDIRRVAETYVVAYRLLATGRRTEIHAVSNPVILCDGVTSCVD